MEIIFTIVFFVLFLELVVAFVFYPFKNGSSFYRLMANGGGKVFRFDRELGYDLKPSIDYQNPTAPPLNAPRKIQFVDVKTDKYGFLFAENIEKLKNEYKLIFCLGGSTTMGSESRSDRTYPSALDALVSPLGYRSINAGVGGYRSIHELKSFRKKILPKKPHAIILFSGYNDFEDSAYNLYKPFDPHTHCLSQSLPTSQLEVLLQKSALYFILKRLVYFFNKKIRKETLPKIAIQNLSDAASSSNYLIEWLDNVRKIIKDCRQNDIKIFILSHASPVFKGATQEAKVFADKDLNMQGMFDIFVTYIETIEAATRKLCDAEGAEFINVNESFDVPYRQRFGFFTDRMHFSEDGNRTLATAIFENIKSKL